MTATGDSGHAKPGHFWSDVFDGLLFVQATLPRRGKELRDRFLGQFREVAELNFVDTLEVTSTCRPTAHADSRS